MKANILKYGDSDRVCDFEEWDNESKELKACGKRSVASIGKKMVCVEHVVDALAFSTALDMFGVVPINRKNGPVISFKEDFLKLCKKQDEINRAAEINAKEKNRR